MERKKKEDNESGEGIGLLGGLLLGLGGLIVGVAGKLIYDEVTKEDNNEQIKPKKKTKKEKEEEKAVEAFQNTKNAEINTGVISSFICPITNEIMKDPVITPNGISYEREAIEKWLSKHDTDPITKTTITKDNLIANYALKNAILDYIQSQKNIIASPTKDQA